MLWPMLVYFAAVLLVVAALIAVSHVLGERHRERATDEAYESGIPPTGSARLRISAQFYLMAMFFVIFDLGAAFVFAWAIVVRRLGWTGYVGLLIFITTLVSGLLYLSRQGALDWGAQSSQDRADPKRGQEDSNAKSS
jgi:NADH-quinone oxidoreductase subunit A